MFPPIDRFGYALGVILSDGSVWVHRQMGNAYNSRTREMRLNPDGTAKRRVYVSHRISLQCKDEAFAARFSIALSELCGKPVPYRKEVRIFRNTTLPGTKQGHVFNGFRILAVHKETALRLLSAKINIEHLDYNRQILEAMLVGIVDGDGYVSKRDGNILIRQKRYTTLFSNLCRKLEIPHRVSFYEGQSASEIYIPKAFAKSIATYKHP